ncbi:hypothetical protein [Candidatus Laterigemmans baculatus]|uniref:hypothetical protein n=1 Tax=Candidatus Laterigemmans baculatus TaxID=2770505 RepID=UPI0013DBB2CF|nr:hypothetical protein [Candidatus Laterigemmans baculatus]
MFPIFKWAAAPALGLAMTLAGEAPQAEAGDSFRLQLGRFGIAVDGHHGHHGHYRHYDHHRHHGYRSHYRGHYGGHYGHRYRGYHDTSHYDYHPPTIVPHRGHYDYIPGHYHFHRSGHYHH